MSSRFRRLAAPVAAFSIGLAALLVAAFLAFAPPAQTGVTSGIGGPFRLLDGEGRAVTERDLEGAPFLVFFGFTHCPDICPTKLFQISEIFRSLGEGGGRTRALFITVDPERDTPPVMKSYMSSFDPRILALTGERPEIDKVIREYRAYSRKVPLAGGDYTMEHTALVYLMDKAGRFVGSFNVERDPAEAAADLTRRL